jgi:hypothetical protein
MTTALPPVQPDTVDAMLETLKYLLGDEKQREQGMQARGATLFGLVGILIAAATALVKPTTHALPAGAPRAVAAALLAAFALLLLASISLLFSIVLRPGRQVTLGAAWVQDLEKHESVAKAKVMIQGETLRGLIAMLGTDRLRNDLHAKRLWLAHLLLLLGLFDLATLGFIVGGYALT